VIERDRGREKREEDIDRKRYKENTGIERF
jgi:hypothetical protein